MLDPLLLWDSSLHRDAQFAASLEEKLLAYVDTYTGAEFTVIFSAPSLAYWQSHADGDLDTYCNVIRVLAAPLSARENVTLYFPGQEEWLISNPDAYDTPRELNAVAARSTMLLILSGAMQYRDTEDYNSLDHFPHWCSRRSLPLPPIPTCPITISYFSVTASWAITKISPPSPESSVP